MSDQVPVPDLGALERADGAPRDFGLRIASDGSWLHRGSPIRRMELVRLFASVLRRDAAGRYWLVTPVERGLIEVEDAPFVMVELAAEGEGPGQRLRLRTNLDHWVTLGVCHPLRLGRPQGLPPEAGAVPYVELAGGLEARLSRSVYYELVELGTTRLEDRRERGVADQLAGPRQKQLDVRPARVDVEQERCDVQQERPGDQGRDGVQRQRYGVWSDGCFFALDDGAAGVEVDGWSGDADP